MEIEQHFYLNFKELTGEIWKITNELDISTPYIEVDKTTMVEFAEEHKKMRDYIVVPSSDKTAKYEIKFKHKDLSEFDVDSSIHQLSKVVAAENSSAFSIIQNIKNGTWTISLTEELRELLTSTLYYKDKNQVIYITKKNDPNILLDTLDIMLYNVLYTDYYVMPGVNSVVAKNKDVSLYCGKVFENYYHILETE
tara:strand:- start:9500 stop:10084 length:585 start_codon:yes stop_codon:yes gene_type:complete